MRGLLLATVALLSCAVTTNAAAFNPLNTINYEASRAYVECMMEAFTDVVARTAYVSTWDGHKQACELALAELLDCKDDAQPDICFTLRLLPVILPFAKFLDYYALPPVFEERIIAKVAQCGNPSSPATHLEALITAMAKAKGY